MRGTSVFVALALLGAGCVSYFAVDHVYQHARLLVAQRASADSTTRWIASEIESKLRRIESQVHEIGTRLATGELDRENVGAACIAQINKNPGLYGLGPTFEPLEAPDRDLYDPYWRRSGSEIVMIPSDDASSDYSLPDPGPTAGARRTHWYHVPMTLGSAWVEPYYCLEGETLMVTYGERFQLPADSAPSRRGVMVGDLSLHWLRELLSGFPIGRTGYAMILSEEDRFIAHPNRALLEQTLNEVLITPTLANASELAVLRFIASAEAETLDGMTLDGERAREIHVEPIGPAGWLLVTVFESDEIVPTMDAERRSRTAILLATFPLLIGLLGSLLPQRLSISRARVLVAAISLLLVVGIGLQWQWSLRFPTRQQDDEYPVFDEGMTNAVLARLLPSGPNSGEAASPLAGDWESSDRIPTGAFIQSAKFLGPYNVAVTGYIWQRGYGDEGPPGVVFPEAEELTLDPVSSEPGLSRWYFTANLRQTFDYKTYPIDRAQIWIRLWPSSFDQGTTLVPDFDAYDEMDRSAKPGLEKSFVLEGWDCIGTHFSYRANSYGVDFGERSYLAHNDRPELYFNIDIRRKFIGPFISDLMPMLVVAVLLFAILMIQSRRDESGLLGFSASTVLSYCSGLFFVLIISHVYVREKLAVPQIIYIEWFYFTMYVLLLLLSLNAVQFARGRRMQLFGLEETEWVTLAYWPVTLGILFLLTLRTFF